MKPVHLVVSISAELENTVRNMGREIRLLAQVERGKRLGPRPIQIWSSAYCYELLPDHDIHR